MKASLKIEEVLMLVLSIVLFLPLDYAWWWFLVFFLAPDISMAGYILGSRVGAITYNLVHHKGGAILVFILGLVLDSQRSQAGGLVMFGHSSFDRALGYGLKYLDSFRHTHLGMIGARSE